MLFIAFLKLIWWNVKEKNKVKKNRKRKHDVIKIVAYRRVSIEKKKYKVLTPYPKEYN